MRFSWLLLLAPAGVLLVALAARVRNRETLGYSPKALSENEFAALGRAPGWQIDRLRTGDGSAVLAGLVRRPLAPGAPFVLFFAGNGEEQLRSGQKLCDALRDGRDWGFAVWAHRGYDASTGVPGADAFHDDALVISRHLETSYGRVPESVHLVGFSMGAETAWSLGAELARRGHAPPGIALLSSYTPPYEMLRFPLQSRFWPFTDSYDPSARTADVRSPVLVVHSQDDPLCPVQQARDLAKALGGRATCVEVKGPHVATANAPEAIAAIRKFVQGPPPGTL